MRFYSVSVLSLAFTILNYAANATDDAQLDCSAFDDTSQGYFSYTTSIHLEYIHENPEGWEPMDDCSSEELESIGKVVAKYFDAVVQEDPGLREIAHLDSQVTSCDSPGGERRGLRRSRRTYVAYGAGSVYYCRWCSRRTSDGNRLLGKTDKVNMDDVNKQVGEADKQLSKRVVSGLEKTEEELHKKALEFRKKARASKNNEDRVSNLAAHRGLLRKSADFKMVASTVELETKTLSSIDSRIPEEKAFTAIQMLERLKVHMSNLGPWMEDEAITETRAGNRKVARELDKATGSVMGYMKSLGEVTKKLEEQYVNLADDNQQKAIVKASKDVRVIADGLEMFHVNLQKALDMQIRTAEKNSERKNASFWKEYGSQTHKAKGVLAATLGASAQDINKVGLELLGIKKKAGRAGMIFNASNKLTELAKNLSERLEKLASFIDGLSETLDEKAADEVKRRSLEAKSIEGGAGTLDILTNAVDDLEQAEKGLTYELVPLNKAQERAVADIAKDLVKQDENLDREWARFQSKREEFEAVTKEPDEIILFLEEEVSSYLTKIVQLKFVEAPDWKSCLYGDDGIKVMVEIKEVGEDMPTLDELSCAPPE